MSVIDYQDEIRKIYEMVGEWILTNHLVYFTPFLNSNIHVSGNNSISTNIFI